MRWIILAVAVVVASPAVCSAQTDDDAIRRFMLYERERRSPGAAVFWSLMIAGGGQYYNGQPGKGTGLLMGTAAAAVLAVKEDDRADAGKFWLLVIALRIASIGDAYSTAEEINARLRQKYGLEFSALPAGVALAYRF